MKLNCQSIPLKGKKGRIIFRGRNTISKLNRSHLTNIFIKRHKSKENPILKFKYKCKCIYSNIYSTIKKF